MPTKIVPHFLIMLFCFILLPTILILFMMGNHRSSTVVASNVECKVIGYIMTSKTFDASVDCAGHKTDVGQSKFVGDMIAKHPSVIVCDHLYLDDNIDGCKIP